MKALIIIDMLNGFCRKGYPLSLNSSTENIEEYIRLRAEKYLSNGDKVIFVCDNHELEDPEIFHPYPPHCMVGTKEVEIVDSLKSLLKYSTVLKKKTLSIFYNTGLESLLSELNPSEIEITGVCTDICDLFAVYDLRIRGYNVFVSRNGVLPLEQDKQEEFLNYFKYRLGANIE